MGFNSAFKGLTPDLFITRKEQIPLAGLQAAPIRSEYENVI